MCSEPSLMFWCAPWNSILLRVCWRFQMWLLYSLLHIFFFPLSKTVLTFVTPDQCSPSSVTTPNTDHSWADSGWIKNFFFFPRNFPSHCELHCIANLFSFNTFLKIACCCFASITEHLTTFKSCSIRSRLWCSFPHVLWSTPLYFSMCVLWYSLVIISFGPYPSPTSQHEVSYSFFYAVRNHKQLLVICCLIGSMQLPCGAVWFFL